MHRELGLKKICGKFYMCFFRFSFFRKNNWTWLLKGPTGQIRSAREWYQSIGLSKDMPRYRFLIFLLLNI
jgi:hypothetical protein